MNDWVQSSPELIAGIVLLTLGRKVYWFLVGVVGFAVGFILSEQYLAIESKSIVLLLALLVGVLSASLVVFFKKVALAVVGFLAGAYLLFMLAQEMGWDDSVWMWALITIGGVVSAVAMRFLFEVALIVLTSLLGAALVSTSVSIPDLQPGIIFMVLAVVGIVFQSLLSRKSAGKEKD